MWKWPYDEFKPRVRTMVLVGSTGSGKTTAAIYPAEDRAFEILRKCVGDTNTTLHDRHYVYTTDSNLSDLIIVGAKLRDEIVTTDLLCTMFAESWAEAIYQRFTHDPTALSSKPALLDSIRKRMLNVPNTEAVFTLLPEDAIDDLIAKIISIYESNDMYSVEYDLWQDAIGDTNANQKSPSKIKSRIADAIRDCGYCIDSDDNVRSQFLDVLKAINVRFASTFFTHFNREQRTTDGYHYRDIQLDQPDESFISAMFSANDLDSDNAVSIECLCDDLVIYVPMSGDIIDILERVDIHGLFTHTGGICKFAITDTVGFFHQHDKSCDDHTVHCEELINGDSISAMLFVTPFDNDANYKNTQRVFEQALENFNKDTPIISLTTKVDFAAQPPKIFVRDIPTVGFPPYTAESAISKIKEHEELTSKSLITKRDKYKSQVKSVSCAFAYSDGPYSLTSVIAQHYSPKSAYESIFTYIVRFEERNGYRLKFKLLGHGPAVLTVAESTLLDASLALFTPKARNEINNNIELNSDRRPHGNSYKALSYHVRNGEGFTSRINTHYFVNCENIAVEFPNYLRNYIINNKSTIQGLVKAVLTLDGGQFETPSDLDRFFEHVSRLLSPRLFVQYLLYNNAMRVANCEFFSYESKFNAFLHYSERAVTPSNQYIFHALKDVLLESAHNVLSLYVRCE